MNLFLNYAMCPNIFLSLLFDIHIIPILPVQCNPLQTGFWVLCYDPRCVSVYLVLRHGMSQARSGLALLPPGAIFWDSFFLFKQISYVTFSQPGSSPNLILPACFLLPLSLIIWISTKSSVLSRKWEEEGHKRRRGETKTYSKFKDFINHVPLKEELPFLQGAALVVTSIGRLVTVSWFYL